MSLRTLGSFLPGVVVWLVFPSLTLPSPGTGEVHMLGLEEEHVRTGSRGRKPQMILPVHTRLWPTPIHCHLATDLEGVGGGGVGGAESCP